MIPLAPEGGTPFEKICEHPKEMQFIRVHSICVTCETTVIFCRVCGKDLTEPETDCR